MSEYRDVVAGNVRRLRTARRLTVAELARRADVGRATLTDLEAGRANPTLETIEVLARELGTSVHGLLEPAPQDRVVHVRAAEGPVKNNGVLSARLLHRSGVADGLIELWHVSIASASDAQHSPEHAHGVVEQLYLLKGGLLAGPVDRPVRLRAGDLLTFAADQPHLYHSPQRASQALIQMFYPPATSESSLISQGLPTRDTARPSA